MQFNNSTFKSDLDIAALKKYLKAKDKEIQNLDLKFSNSRDTTTALKSELSSIKSSKSMLESKVKKLELKVCKLQERKVQKSVLIQTSTTVDTPYTIAEPLPPIFGSDLCYQTKPGFFTKSLPDLSKASWFSRTEEYILLDQADEALDHL